MKLDEKYFDRIFVNFQAKLKELNKVIPAVSYVAITQNDPYCVLISTILSLRTKDDVTLQASVRLFNVASNPAEMLKLSPDQIEKLIFPTGFYKTKAQRILEISQILMDKYGGKVPSTVEELLALPGVGIKTANLTLNLGFGIDAICVDCHVHQISNRMGWIKTSTPEESEKVLQTVMPKKYWIPLNELLVSYGQEVCTSVSPKCSMCPENESCPKVGVTRSR
ncbi:MAG: endonuclease III domain-containing protein [Spirochaetales bacterium]